MESQLWSPYNEVPPQTPLVRPRTGQAPLGTQIPWPTDFTYIICSMFWKHIKARVSGYIELRRSDEHYGEQPQLSEKLRTWTQSICPRT